MKAMWTIISVAALVVLVAGFAMRYAGFTTSIPDPVLGYMGIGLIVLVSGGLINALFWRDNNRPGQ